MRQITVHQLVEQASKANIEGWLPFELTCDGDVIAVVNARHDVPQTSEVKAPLYVAEPKPTPITKRLRSEVFDLLGRECVHCGFDDYTALQIDHINGGGKREIEAFNNANNYYRHILEIKGKGYQTLCANCNVIKARIHDVPQAKGNFDATKTMYPQHKRKQVVATTGLRFSKSIQAAGRMR